MPKRKPGAVSNDDVNRRFGVRLRLFREVAGRSQSEVGDALGVSFQQIQKYENGTTSISLNRMADVATYLQVSMAKLIDDLHERSPMPLPHGFAEPGQASYGDDQDLLLGSGAVSKQKVALLSAFNQIADPGVRRSVLALLESIAESTSFGPAEPG